MLGVLINSIAVVFGSLLGVILKKGIPQKMEATVMAGLGFCTLVIGIKGALESASTVVMIISMVVGSILGSWLDLDRQANRLGAWVERRFTRPGGNTRIAEGFVNASLLFCIGAMAIVGSFNAGLRGDNEMLYTKSLLDFFAAMMLSVSLGIGVALSGACVFLYQGAIALLAGVLEPILSQTAITEIGALGSVMIMVIGMNVAGITKIKVANMLPGILLVPFLCTLAEKIKLM